MPTLEGTIKMVAGIPCKMLKKHAKRHSKKGVDIVCVRSLEQFCQGDAVLGEVLDKSPHAAGESGVQGA